MGLPAASSFVVKESWLEVGLRNCEFEMENPWVSMPSDNMDVNAIVARCILIVLFCKYCEGIYSTDRFEIVVD